MENMDRKGAIPFNPNLLHSKTAKAITLGILTFAAAACSAKVDQGAGSGNPVLEDMRMQATMDSARSTYQANATPEPNYPATEQAKNSELPDGSPRCIVINKNETASNIILQMGLWPDSNDIEGGIVPSIAIYRKGVMTADDPIAIIDALKGGTAADDLDIGDEFCAGNPTDLIRRQAPTPQSSLPNRFQRSQAGFSPAKGSQPVRPVSFRRA